MTFMATSPAPITFWNRAEKREQIEQVYGDGFVRFLYGTAPGQAIADLFAGRAISQAYGALQASFLSRRKIQPFIRKFKIPMEEYEDPGFQSFNDFFIRKFKPGRRVFAADSSRMPAPAEARYLAWDRIAPDQTFPVKGTHLSAAAILGVDSRLAQEFEGGPLMIARLCPVDYHRYHYPDDGSTLEHYRVGGKLHSVNPLALKANSEILATNERYVSILETRNFGKLAYVEVGAMMVGRIVQTHAWDQPFKRGDEKGYFLFGGSTVIVLGQAGKWRPDSDILEQTARNRETYVRIGDALALASTKS
jgi:phosphatidylserine decarboxylase